jgi:hypothetical protein
VLFSEVPSISGKRENPSPVILGARRRKRQDVKRLQCPDLVGEVRSD